MVSGPKHDWSTEMDYLSALAGNISPFRNRQDVPTLMDERTITTLSFNCQQRFQTLQNSLDTESGFKFHNVLSGIDIEDELGDLEYGQAIWRYNYREGFS